MPNLTWQDILTIISVLIGVVTVIAYVDQRRAMKSQRMWEKFVSRHVDKDISTEELAALKGEQAKLERQVSEEVPRIARRAVLAVQAEIHKRALLENFTEWQRVSAEIEETPEAALDPKIQKAVVDRLMPAYQRQQNLDGAKDRLFILSLTLTASGFLLPEPIDKLVQAILVLLLAASLMKYVSMRSSSDQQKKRIVIIASLIYLLTFLSIFLWGIVVSYVFMRDAEISMTTIKQISPGIVLSLVAALGLSRKSSLKTWASAKGGWASVAFWVGVIGCCLFAILGIVWSALLLLTDFSRMRQPVFIIGCAAVLFGLAGIASTSFFESWAAKRLKDVDSTDVVTKVAGQ